MDFDRHVITTNELWSFRDEGAPLNERKSICSAFRYGSGPDAVLIPYGIQGEDFFKAFAENADQIWAGAYCVMGYVWQRHTAIYKRILRGKFLVEVLWSGRPYGAAGPVFDWIVGRKIGQWRVVGPKALWDKEG